MLASNAGSITFLKVPVEYCGGAPCWARTGERGHPKQEVIQECGEIAATRPVRLAIATQVEERFLSSQADASRERSGENASACFVRNDERSKLTEI